MKWLVCLICFMLLMGCATVKKAAVLGWVAVEVVDIFVDDEPKEEE